MKANIYNGIGTIFSKIGMRFYKRGFIMIGIRFATWAGNWDARADNAGYWETHTVDEHGKVTKINAS